MLIAAVAVLAVVFLPLAHGRLAVAVALLCIATAAHQGWSSNLFTVASDVFPRAAVGSAAGLGGLGGAVGGMLIAPVVGYWLRFSHSAYGPVFVVLGFLYLLALGILHLLAPRLDQTSV